MTLFPEGAAVSYLLEWYPRIRTTAHVLAGTVKLKIKHPFEDDDAIILGPVIVEEIVETKRNKWRDLIENLDFYNDSRKPWLLSQKLNGKKKQKKNEKYYNSTYYA